MTQEQEVLKNLVKVLEKIEQTETNLAVKVMTLENDMKMILEHISQLYQSMVGFFSLLQASADNIIMIFQSVDTSPFFQHPETKAKMDELMREYESFSEWISRLNEVWKEIFQTKKKEEIPYLIGRLSEIMNQVLSHEDKFLQLKNELWLKFLKWKKEAESNQ